MKRTDNVQRVFTNQIPQLITMASNLVMNIGYLAARFTTGATCDHVSPEWEDVGSMDVIFQEPKL